MRALVTNDDGIDSTGLRALARVATEAGLDVVVAAPDTEYSGSSASLTAPEQDGKLLMHEKSLPGLDGVGVEATPGFIASPRRTVPSGPCPTWCAPASTRAEHRPRGAALGDRRRGTDGVDAWHVGPGDVVRLARPRARGERDRGGYACARLAGDNAGGDPLTLSVNVPDRPLADVRGLRTARGVVVRRGAGRRRRDRRGLRDDDVPRGRRGARTGHRRRAARRRLGHRDVPGGALRGRRCRPLRPHRHLNESLPTHCSRRSKECSPLQAQACCALQALPWLRRASG